MTSRFRRADDLNGAHPSLPVRQGGFVAGAALGEHATLESDTKFAANMSELRRVYEALVRHHSGQGRQARLGEE